MRETGRIRRLRGVHNRTRVAAAMCLCVGALAVAAPSAMAKAVIRGVSFGGSEIDPTVTITGKGFGKTEPAHDELAGCHTAPIETYFPNGGKGMYFHDLNRFWNAGAVENCIGFTAVNWTKTQIVFQFGDDYRTEPSWTLKSGDEFDVQVKTASFSGTVAY